jgi:glutamate transport system substrate-binding protein
VSDIAVESQSRSTSEEPAPWRKGVTTICVFALFALSTVAACTHNDESKKPAVDEVKAESGTLSDIRAEDRRLRIAVWDNVPYISYMDPRTKEYRGFDIDIARAIAADLDFRESMIEWVSLADLSDRLSVLKADKADLVVASFSMTSDRLVDVTFAGPYLVVPQAVLVPRGRSDELNTIAELKTAGVTVCTTTGSTSEEVLKSRGINYDPQDTNADCMKGMRDGDYEAFSTDRHILAAFDQDDEDSSGEDRFEIVETAIAKGDENIGIAVPKDDEALHTLVTHYLYCWKLKEREGGSPWIRAYEKSLAPLLPDTPQPHVDKPKYPDVDKPPYLADHECMAPQG